ncbi:MAG TPA: LamG-like jellyroll fold domain-containing protein, partial [Acidimicrobiales bacterium]
RDPLMYDAVNAGVRVADDDSLVVIGYDETIGSPTFGKPLSVSDARPTAAGVARPRHDYEYLAGETKVDVAGLTPPTPRDFARKVTFDQAGRSVAESGLDGLVATQEWEATADRVLSSTDATGRKSTTIYDYAGRSIESYGPAPSAWYGSDRKPLAAYLAQVPKATTAYDRDAKGDPLRGLAAAYWANETLSGPAKLHSLGVGQPLGDLYVQWGSGGPKGLGVTDGFGARYTGEITFPAAGYTLTTCADNGARVWIDDVRVIDGWTTVGCTTSTWTSPGGTTPQRIRVDMHETTLSSDIGLYWTPPGGSRVGVPGQYLGPRYSLTTSTVDAHGTRTDTAYADPSNGLATKTVADAGGLRLATEVAYEAEGAGYRRRTGRRLPAAAYESHVLADGPAAYWRLNELHGPTAVDSSGNNRHATLRNWTESQDGVSPVDRSTEFFHSGATAGDVLDMSGGQAFTVEAWVKPAVDASGTMRLLAKEHTNGSGRQGWLLFVKPDNSLGFERIRDGSINGVGGGVTRPGVWTHVAGTYDGTTMRLYVDGAEVGNATSTLDLIDNPAPLYIGESLRGMVDEAAVYTSALANFRVSARWRNFKQAVYSAQADAPLAYWRLSETAGTTALDSSGNQRHATYGAGALGQKGTVEADTAVLGNGSTIANAGDFGDAAGLSPFTVEAWINPTTQTQTWRKILSKETSDANGRQGWSLWYHNGTAGFERFGGSEWNTAAGGTIPAGQWSHVSARFSGSTMRLFVNGSEVATTASSLSLVDTTTPVLIGAGFQGSLSHVGIYPTSVQTPILTRHYRDGATPFRSTGSEYYGATETRTDPCGIAGTAVQAGLQQLVLEPDADGWGGTLGRSEETVYDVMGRPVATRINAEA